MSSICIAYPSVCSSTISIMSTVREDLVNQDRLSIYFGHFSGGTSLKNLQHMG
jgi:hypothetical protein